MMPLLLHMFSVLSWLHTTYTAVLSHCSQKDCSHKEAAPSYAKLQLFTTAAAGGFTANEGAQDTDLPAPLLVCSSNLWLSF